jgi:hypothetical protein
LAIIAKNDWPDQLGTAPSARWSRIYRAGNEEFVDHQVASVKLIREDEKRMAEEKLEALLLEGLNSGDPIENTPEYWEEKRQQLIKRHRQRMSVR